MVNRSLNLFVAMVTNMVATLRAIMVLITVAFSLKEAALAS